MNVRFTRSAGQEAVALAADLELRRRGWGDDFEAEMRQAVAAIGSNPYMHSKTEDGPSEPETRNYYIARFE